jgi:hypothetical protein
MIDGSIGRAGWIADMMAGAGYRVPDNSRSKEIR